MDLHPGNILISSSAADSHSLNISLVDFGLTGSYSYDNRQHLALIQIFKLYMSKNLQINNNENKIISQFNILFPELETNIAFKKEFITILEKRLLVDSKRKGWSGTVNFFLSLLKLSAKYRVKPNLPFNTVAAAFISLKNLLSIIDKDFHFEQLSF